jgi:hypothetical protein
VDFEDTMAALPLRSIMVRRLSAASLALAAAGCGARSELAVPDAGCAPLDIGIFGKPGAYDKGDFDQWLVASGAGVQRLLTTPDEPLTEATLAPFDVVVLDWLRRDYTPAEAAALAAWITAGGGVVSMSGFDNVTTDDWHANSLIAPLGVAYGGPLLDGPVTDLAPHPITAGLTSVVFEGGFAIIDLGGSASTRTPIAFLSTAGGTVTVGEAIELANGRAFVWGDEWIEFFSRQPLFPPQLWMQAFAWVSPKSCALRPPR